VPLLDLEDTCVVVIDAQDGFYGDDRYDVDREEFERILTRCAWVVGVAAGLGVAVVVTEEDSDRNGRTAPGIREVLPAEAQVLAKVAFAVPDNPEILEAITRLGCSTVVLVGLETEVCVAQSALQFKERGNRVVVVHDAVFSPGSAHENGLRRLQASGIELISAKEVMYDWVRTVDRVREFGALHADLMNPPGFSL
jgi:nicotinamidase-related amidase